MKINGEVFNIKEKIVELIQTNKFVVSIPKEYWEDEILLKDTMKRIETVTKHDIEVLSHEMKPEKKEIGYVVNIAGLTEYQVDVKLNGEIKCTQLTFKSL